MIKCTVALLVGGAMSACGSPTAPTPPSAAPTLFIVSTADGVVVGGQMTLTATLVTGAADRRTVTATWSSSAPDVASIDTAGNVTGRRLGTTTITAAFDNQSAKLDLSAVNDYAGTWKGQYVVTDCTRQSGNGSSYCRFIIGQPLNLELSINQRGTTVTGTLSFVDTRGMPLTTGPLSGESTVTGELRLTARVRSVGPEQPETTDVADWTSSLTPDQSQMTGRFVKNREFVNAFGPQKSREVCELRSASRF